MVNGNAVNAEKRVFPPPYFHEFFPASGGIPRFQNPVKYARIFDFNQNTVYAAAARPAIAVYYQRVTYSKGALPTIAP